MNVDELLTSNIRKEIISTGDPDKYYTNMPSKTFQNSLSTIAYLTS